MLAIYERRQFSAGEKIWFGRYRNLTNVLHWHFESEIIRVVSGKAKIKIGDFSL
jgi:xylan 1,4-beta-xylosidase